MTDRIRRRAVVTGSVQGVGFRWSARLEAQRLGVTGYARNRVDGAVQVEAEGEPAAVDAFVAWLRTGPPSAAVAGVEVGELEPTGSAGFEVA
ncbi:acylphosphatase [Conyzicola lurida]|uniref:Acylphosphatase n=1 Tax=Conyzicola lurida TaxID=1172621 RepID=A0A841AKV2_9MICO|nr:acylphosphatase [Conyzicola lurida]MBB5843024.1 acylphosphatase [Conyzicola lurida]